MADVKRQCRRTHIKIISRLPNGKQNPEYDRAYRELNREKILKRNKDSYAKDRKGHMRKTHNRRLQTLFGISLDQYENILVAQNYKCAICGDTCIGKSKRLSLDHDHKTGKVRQLLCFRCNAAIGMARESTNILKNMIDYLDKWR